VRVRNAMVTRELAGPLDRAVRALFPVDGQPVSWGTARDWIAAGKVRVAGSVVTEATTRVPMGAQVTFHEQARRPRAGRLTDDAIVYLDPHVVIVAKAPGVSTVPYDATEKDTLDVRVRAWLGGRSGGARSLRPSLGIVHRLDKETSGLVVFTRTWLAKQKLASQFRKHTVHRRYMAIAHGEVRSRTIRSFIAPDRGDGLRGSVRRGQGQSEREAVTHVERIEALAGATLVACRLETGRTHQIRIHLSEAGHPLLGERVYRRRWTGVVIEAPRLMLHAAELGFVHPATEQPMRWELAIPEDMRAVLEGLRRRHSRPRSLA
jgi:23S rRNA pseudouridine1911/1915/1917 synthase